MLELLQNSFLGLRMAIYGYETPAAVDVRQPHSFTGPSRFLTPIHATQFGLAQLAHPVFLDLQDFQGLRDLLDLLGLLGQPFFFSLVSFLESPSGLVTAINTNPNVNWIRLDRGGKSISGQVPIDYPAGPVTVTVTAQYNIAGRNVDRRDFETRFVIVLNVFLPVSPMAPGSVATPTPLTTVPRESPSRSLPPIITSAHLPPSTIPWVTSTFTPPTSTTLTTATDLSSTTTTAPSTTRTRPTAVPTPTIYQGQPFTIGKEAYELNEGDILNGVSSNPPTDWIILSQPNLSRPCCITGVVPADWTPGPINVTLNMYSRFTSPSFAYFTSFIVIVMESPHVSTTSAI
ncbi:hypothetical protein INS49_006867 [Diaporthe citri]|uniref:uncharacterized protein n=1 Tax=Diaporthe citri TaxID=83186 RepID=UPI001C7FEB82|nr:uncharacterized protein INS49_006867 [Diaporthe citri]KAG6365258.1 hypothetical protein INS49_006867 [Diaporthe citri]